MINRSALKYSLKKILPKSIFTIVVFVWQKILLHVVQMIDQVRLQKFTKTQTVVLKHHTTPFSLVIDPRNGFIDSHIFLYGNYEPFILDVIHKYLLPGMTFVDIGANIGEHSMYAAALVGEQGSVYAFEPIPRIYEQLTASSKSNHFESIIKAKNVALGNKNSEETFFVSKNIGGSSLVNQNESEMKEKITVTVKHGDTLLVDIGHIDLVKIDVEGYEYEVLTGIKETLAKYHPNIIIEFSGNFYHKHTDNHGIKILELLNSLGYLLYDIEDNMKKIESTESFNIEMITKRNQTNLLCTPHSL